MENMDKELTVPKWVLIVRPKIPQMPQKFQPKMSAQAQKFKIFEKKLSLGVGSPWVERLNNQTFKKNPLEHLSTHKWSAEYCAYNVLYNLPDPAKKIGNAFDMPKCAKDRSPFCTQNIFLVSTGNSRTYVLYNNADPLKIIGFLKKHFHQTNDKSAAHS